MSSAALQLSSASPVSPVREARGVAFIEITDAAKRSGQNPGHLTRQCRAKWLSQGLARRVSGDGKKERWQVREDADAAFARVKFAQQLGADLTKYTTAQRDEATRRRRSLAEWRAAVSSGFNLGFVEKKSTAQYCMLQQAKGVNISRATLFRWEERWDRGGLEGLIDARGIKVESATEVDPFFEEIKRLYLQTRKLKLTVCHEIVALRAIDQGWTPRSLKTCERMLKKIPAAVVLKLRHGEEAFVNHAEPYLERDYSSIDSNDIWCADHHQFDVIVNHNGQLLRPWLTAWQDLRSRKIVAWSLFAHDPNSDPILATFRQGVLEFGVPKSVYIDNGKDFDCYALNGRTKKDRFSKRRVRFELDQSRAGVFPGLQIKVMHALPYHGQSKPIERWFGTVEQNTPVWDTYCGKSTQDKPEDLQLAIERGKAPLFADFTDWFYGIVQAYNAAPHGGDSMDGRSPDSVFTACLQSRRTTTAEALDVYCLRVTQPVKIGQNGVTYNGLKFGQFDLIRQIGQTVVLRVNDADLSTVQVWSEEGKFLAIAKANAKMPFNATSQEVRQAHSDKRKARKLVKEFHDVRPRLADDLPAAILRARREQAKTAAANAPESDLTPPSISPIRSSIDEALPAIQRAAEATTFKQAAGGETAPLLPRVFSYQSKSAPADESFVLRQGGRADGEQS